MELIWKYGEEAICPACHHRNACLWSAGIYTCRDCRAAFVSTGPAKIVGLDPTMHRPVVSRPCRPA